MVLHPTTESKSKLENCGVGGPTVHGYQEGGRSMAWTPWATAERKLRSSEIRGLLGLGSNSWCAPHTPSSVPPSISVTGRDTFNMWWGGSQGLRRRSQLHQKLLFTIVWSAIVAKYLWRNIFGHNCALRASKATTVRGARV